ncbi:hypothetical protein ACFUTV_26655 [Streptomyces sp. NPDC057298]|uniref:hypothetical protein n=1 Tax=Streptomyces sp. NPDC057298 TaxID=3346091 RepID=UPI00363E91C9
MAALRRGSPRRTARGPGGRPTATSSGASGDVTFHRARLARLLSGEFPVDQALFARIERTVDQLTHAIEERDAEQAKAAAALEPIEAAAPRQATQQASTKDFAALLAIVQAPSST